MFGVFLACPAWVILMVRLGGANQASEHRGWYLQFRGRIVSGDVSGFYSHRIARVLTGVDRFFGDTGLPPRRNWTHALFGLRTATPL